MKRILLLWFLLGCLSARATSYTEFYAIGSTGNNLFSGHTPDTAATFSATACNFTNNTSASACTIFKTALNPVTGGVTNGAWCSIYPDGTTTNVFVGLVTASDDTADTITVSLVAKSGNVPATSVAGTSFQIGGAWWGPNTNDVALTNRVFPFGFVQNTMTNTSGNVPRINFKTNVYTCTNILTTLQAGPIKWGGYASTPGDGGRATFNAFGYNIDIINFASGSINNDVDSFVTVSNNASGSSSGFIFAGSEMLVTRCAAQYIGGTGILLSGLDTYLIESEAAYCVMGNGARFGISLSTSANIAVRCTSHDHRTSNGIGFLSGASGAFLIDCNAYNCGNVGVKFSQTSGHAVLGFNAYSNTLAGLDLTGASATMFYGENINSFKNATFGINSSGSATRNGQIQTVRFGTGTQTNLSGNIGTAISAGVLGGIDIVNSNSYAADATPWVDATNGNFTPLTGSIGLAAGRGTFPSYWTASPTNTVSYPDIGSAQTAGTNLPSTTVRRVILSQ